MLCHLSGFLGYFVVIPFASIIGPLVVWLLKKDSSAFVDEHGKESINFQITMSIVYAITWILLFSIIFTLIAIPLFAILGVWIVVLVIVAAIKASQRRAFSLSTDNPLHPINSRRFVSLTPGSRHLTPPQWPTLAYSINAAAPSATSARSRGRWN